MYIMDCISCPYITNDGDCELNMCSVDDVTNCTVWRRLVIRRRQMDAFNERERRRRGRRTKSPGVPI